MLVAMNLAKVFVSIHSSFYMQFTATSLRKKSFAHALGGDSGVVSFITTDEQLQ